MTNIAQNNEKENLPQTLYGIGASPGIVIGRLLHMGRRKTKRRKNTYLDNDKATGEPRRFKDAVDQAEKQLVEIRDQFADQLEEYMPIIDTHILMLRDKMIYDRTLEYIENEKINAEWALEKALNQVRSVFKQVDDQYLRERVHDVEHVAVRLFRVLAGKEVDPFAEIDDQVIVVSRDFSPEDTVRMPSDRVLGFLTEMGGVTSHTAIVARSLGIPAVVGVENLCRQVATDDLVILDGNTGRIYLHPTQDQVELYKGYQRQYQRYSEQVEMFNQMPAETIDGLKVRVYANIEMMEELDSARRYGAGGIGLFRSEYSYIGKESLPDEETLFGLYKGLLSCMAPLPVTIRTLDVGGDKIASSIPFSREANPALGLRAIRFSLREPELFGTQIRALLRASIHGNLRIMFPMISALCEVKRVKEIIAGVREDLDKEGHPYDDAVKIGLMIEVPSAVSVADVLACEVDFFSIGTNDLIQYALAIDRGNEHVAHMYEPFHPAILRMIKQVADVAHKAGIEVGLCGEMAGDVACLPLLLGLGLDELSMPPLAIPYIKRMIRGSTAEEMEKLANEVLHCTAAQEIVDYLANHLPQRYPEEFGEDGLRRMKRSCCSVTMDNEMFFPSREVP